MVEEHTIVQNARGEFDIFSVDIRFDEINNMDNFIADGKAASLENEFKNYKTDFIYKDRDFGLGYNMGKRQKYLQKNKSES